MKKILYKKADGKHIKIIFLGKKIISISLKGKILSNVFHKNNKKRVLISYIKEPFLASIGDKKYHTNLIECQTAARIFDQLNYNVDVIEYTDLMNKKNLKKYDVVYGFGKSFEAAFIYPNITKILYGTGCSVWYQNLNTLKRLYEFKDKTGIFAYSSGRFINSDLGATGAMLADKIIALGNKFVADTYKITGLQKEITHLPIFYFDVYDIDLDKKDFQNARKNFLWFGSSGCIHKGLDILIDIFLKRKDINLTICGASPYEQDFCKYYSQVFENKVANIRFIPFVNIDSAEFKEIMNKCGTVIFPSASEGGCPGVIQVMANGGLIPVLSRSCGLDVENLGFVFDEITEKNVLAGIDQVCAMSEDEMKEKSICIKKAIRKDYTLEKYKINLKNQIKQFLDLYDV